MFEYKNDDMEEKDMDEPGTEFDHNRDPDDGSVASIEGDDSELEDEQLKENKEEQGWDDVTESTVGHLKGRLVNIKI